jgi:hypothetical protein
VRPGIVVEPLFTFRHLPTQTIQDVFCGCNDSEHAAEISYSSRVLACCRSDDLRRQVLYLHSRWWIAGGWALDLSKAPVKCCLLSRSLPGARHTTTPSAAKNAPSSGLPFLAGQPQELP